jgi:hypothetical protein
MTATDPSLYHFVHRHWRALLAPALVLWALSAFLTGGLHLSTGDLTEYHRYAVAAVQAHPMHRFPLEYPASALAVFAIPLLMPLSYPWAFALLVGVITMALVSGYREAWTRHVDVASARRLVVYLALGAAMFLTARYDLFAVAAAFFALRAAREERWPAAWTWSSIGFLLKLFPAALWPVLIVAEWRVTGRMPWRRVAWIVASSVVLFGVPALVEPGAVLNEFHYYLRRPPEIGSVASGLALLTDWHGWHYVLSYHSVNAVSPMLSALAAATTSVAVCLCVVTWWLQWRGRLPLEAAALLTLTLLVLGMKVLSVQYLLWLMPFWALYRVQAAWVAACVLNMIVFPYTVSATTLGYIPARGYVVSLTVAYLLRDVSIAAGTVLWLRSLARGREMAINPFQPPGAPALAKAQVSGTS